MTKAVAEREEAGLPATMSPDPGMTGVPDESDVITPMCSIVQPSSGSERGEAGSYWWSGGLNAETFEAVVLHLNFTRTLWAPKASGMSTPVCRSADREKGWTRVPQVVASGKPGREDTTPIEDALDLDCNACQHYEDDSYGGGDWLCTKGQTLLLYNHEQGPFIFYVKGTAVGPVRRAIISPALLRHKQGRPANLCGTRWAWGLSKTENDKGKFYVPTVAVSEVLDLAAVAEHEGIAAEMRGSVSEQMVAAAQTEGGQGPA